MGNGDEIWREWGDELNKVISRVEKRHARSSYTELRARMEGCMCVCCVCVSLTV